MKRMHTDIKIRVYLYTSVVKTLNLMALGGNFKAYCIKIPNRPDRYRIGHDDSSSRFNIHSSTYLHEAIFTFLFIFKLNLRLCTTKQQTAVNREAAV